MDWFMIKRSGATLLAAINLGLLVWALRAYFGKFTLPDRYRNMLLLSPAVAAVQLILGVSFVSSGLQAPAMHIFYGVLVTLGAATQTLLGRPSPLSQTYRGKPLVHAFLALFVGLLSVRSWMAAR